MTASPRWRTDRIARAHAQPTLRLKLDANPVDVFSIAERKDQVSSLASVKVDRVRFECLVVKWTELTISIAAIYVDEISIVACFTGTPTLISTARFNALFVNAEERRWASIVSV